MHITARRSGSLGHALGGSSNTSPQNTGHITLLPQQCTLSQYSLSSSTGQTACDVANAFANPCAASIVVGKAPLDSSSCACNTVMYSLVYACLLCANRLPNSVFPFGQYAGELDCSSTLGNQYNGAIPAGFGIPPWATLGLTGSQSFDVAEAQKVAKQASSPDGPSLTPSTPSPTPRPPTQTPSAEPTGGSTPSSPQGSSESSTPTGASSPPASANSSPAHTANPSATDRAATNSTNTSSSNADASASVTSSVPQLSDQGNLSSPTDTGADPQGDPPSPTRGHSPGRPSLDAPTGTSANHGTTSGAAGTPSNSHIGPIIGGVVAALVALILAALLVFCLLRRRRRQREEEMMRAREPLDWWRRPAGIPTSLPADRGGLSECSTIRGDDADSELETLQCDSVSIEKKSVMYGNYPDI
ncbi:hypothetical protein C8Q73DRAFT_504927 [Cubamyces lactineus]|nr:hypothetical protein C8Q73DRAFT_504927 [Cubamyces lactineus]